MSLVKLLDAYRKSSKTEREKGHYFELLCKVFLSNDPRFTSQFSEVLTYAEWAAKQGLPQKDLGVDLVASLLDGESHCAIQCKFYDENHVIQKRDIDSFFTELGKTHFSQGLIIDTTGKNWSANAENVLVGQSKPVRRIGLSDLTSSSIDWDKYQPNKPVAKKTKKKLREHQIEALAAVKKGFQSAVRGKLIMACGTGKTFVSLKIAETLAGKDKQVLVLMPSLSLMSQTITDWVLDAGCPIHAFAVCSDTHVGKTKKQKEEDMIDISIHDLAYPATTNAVKLAEKVAQNKKGKMTVIFSTYQSIQVVADAHKKGLPEFDLIICDEAHRTTGATLENKDPSNFIKVHNQDIIKGKKRLYMTATSRIYNDAVRIKAKESNAILCSMDDGNIYGEVFYKLNFSDAVEKGLLTDYKVVVLAVNQDIVSASIQKLLSSSDGMKLDDATKLIGCYRALAKIDIEEETKFPRPMKRAVSFCNKIDNSKSFKDKFVEIIDNYLENIDTPLNKPLICETEHVDGTDNASVKNHRLAWLKENTAYNRCRILSNVRCLSEGVDVPALDAIIFLHPRKSMIDVVQCVGRVMRRAEGKKLGYVILPIAVPANKTPEQTLADNETYKVVWQVLNALRSHDENMEGVINKIDLGADVSNKLETIGVGFGGADDSDSETIGAVRQEQASYEISATGKKKQSTFEFDELKSAIYAKLVKNCGDRHYWEDWSKDIADIAQAHISRLNGILSKDNTAASNAFDKFLKEIKDDLNDSISRDDAIEMLAQHLITKPVFDALFEDYPFAENNPVSRAMQEILRILDDHNLDSETKTLDKFYESVKKRAQGINNIDGKQRIIIELYDKFFRTAFKRTTDKLGIVYTPIEVVDFIIHSINDVLQQEFNKTLGSKGVHILDPFTGSGTFITRLLQTGLITQEQLAYKYQHEIHANDIVLLAYYIASINIEQVYQSLTNKYTPFNGICLTDTFQLYEKDDLVSELLVDNSQRRIRQKKLDIRVIMGNPPYSAGQTSANDNNPNVKYPTLDKNIADTYTKHSEATSTKNLQDSYIRAIRWASDKIKDTGIIGFVSNASFVDSSSADGLRKCLKDEFSSLYIFHLRGNQRTSGELSKKEGGKIFGGGSRAPIAISILVKNPKSKQKGHIQFYDIGDGLSRKDKLTKINGLKSIAGITQTNDWQTITPNKHHDWINQRGDSFYDFIQLGDRKAKKAITIFEKYSLGITTARDPWAYNSSKQKLSSNIEKTLAFYNQERERYQTEQPENINDFVINDGSRISWTRGLKKTLTKGHVLKKEISDFRVSIYRPFTKTNLYFNKDMNEYRYQMPLIFPNNVVDNKVICITGLGGKKGFTTLIANILPDINLLEASAQCFPLKLYEPKDNSSNRKLFSDKQTKQPYTIKDGVSDDGLKHFQQSYPKETISKEDIFYYIYGLFHSEEYRARYKDNLSKQLARIPCVKTAKYFWAFIKAGRALADLHLNYETVEPYPVNYAQGGAVLDDLTDADYLVTQMKFAKVRSIDGKSQTDKTSVIYNGKITMTNIPLEAYDYIVNGKPALEWVMERQAVITDKKSGIVNDANDWAKETMNDASYPLKLFQRIITVSLETMKIVRKLPDLDIP